MADTSDEKPQTETPASLPLDDEVALSPADEAAVLAEVDDLLAADDPEFLKQIADIKVDEAAVTLSIMDEALSGMSKPERKPIRWAAHLSNLFDLREDPKKFFLFWAMVAAAATLLIKGPKLYDQYFSKGLFLRSYAEWNSQVQSFNPLTDSEPFYDNPRFAKNLMSMTKIVVNIKASESSGADPMLAMEVNVEGMSSEAIIELKDREAEFKDSLARIAEEYSYDELSSAEGKKHLLDKFAVAINANLTQGQVRRVLLKSFVVKP